MAVFSPRQGIELEWSSSAPSFPLALELGRGRVGNTTYHLVEGSDDREVTVELVVNTVEKGDTGKYTCRAFSSQGAASQPVEQNIVVGNEDHLSVTFK